VRFQTLHIEGLVECAAWQNRWAFVRQFKTPRRLPTRSSRR
jgi:hypothetical protein